MRIGVNAVPLNARMGGLRQYFQRLFIELLATDINNTYVFFYCAGNEEELGYLGTNRWREGAIKIEDQGEILLHLMNIDVFFCPFAVLWPRPIPIPTVVELADIQEVYYPHFFSEEDLRARRLHFAPSTRAADAVITLSEFSKQSIAEHHLIDPDKIFVAHLVADPVVAPYYPTDIGHLSLPDQFIFYPANHWQHKNHDAMLKALAFLKQDQGIVVPCVCTGFPMENGYPLLEKIVEYGLTGQVLHVGYVSNEEMRALYSRATLLCFPSLFEGFGMPVLEAMSSGCPVVCSNATSLPEVVGDAAVLFDPDNYCDVAAAILKVWNNESLREELACKGKIRASKFTVSRLAAIHLQAFEYALKAFLPESRYVYQHLIFDQLAARPTCQELKETDDRLLAIESSLSWRITKPLRWLGDRLRR